MITGASRGLGLEIVRHALDSGATVIAAARKPDNINRALGSSARLLPIELDVTNAEQISAGIATALDHFGRVDVLVNNAGYGHVGPFEASSQKDVNAQYAVNVFG